MFWKQQYFWFLVHGNTYSNADFFFFFFMERKKRRQLENHPGLEDCSEDYGSARITGSCGLRHRDMGALETTPQFKLKRIWA